MVAQETDAVPRIEREQHARVLRRCARARRPRWRRTRISVIGPKNAATLAVPRDCTANRATRIDDRERHHVGVERRRHDLEALDRREHRQRRRDDGVAVEQRAADDAEQDDVAPAAPSARCASAISASVPPSPLLSARSRISTYFSGDDDDQRPDDQRQHAEHDRLARRIAGAGRGQHRLAEARRAGWCRCRRRRRRCCRA